MNIQSNNKHDYNPYIFCCPDFQSAASIILGHHSQPWRERWKRESKYIISLIKSNIELDANSVVLDYGCGVGRLSKLIIETYGCTVVGIDLIPSMLKYAIQWVDDGVDVLQLIQKQFQTMKIDKLPVNVTSSWIHENTWWGIFKKAEKP